MTQLPQVTLIAICGNKHGETLAALYKSLREINPAKTVLITNIDIQASGIECINVGGLDTWEKYNVFCIKELTKYFTTTHVLLVQWDGYVLDGKQWTDEFLDFDYIGAKWLDIGKRLNVGNGGFSLRSKYLQEQLANDDFISMCVPEDNAICKIYHDYLVENYNIRYATEEVADKFSFELNEPMQSTFGFHGFHWPKFRETVVISRSHALGDVLCVEPLLHYYHKKGYQVALETSPGKQDFFIQHYFPVIPVQHLNPNLKYKKIDLNMAYEVFPELSHVEAYFKMAGITDGVVRNPKLSMAFPKDQSTKLFKKYCVLHIDDRAEAYRNIYGIDWEFIVKYLNKKGYTVIQLGDDETKDVKGAVQMKAPTAPMLMWVAGWADLFIGIDSGIAHVASGFDVPSILFFGSVDPTKIYPDLSNKLIIHNHDKDVCSAKFCWHNTRATETGTKCYIDNDKPPCTQYDSFEVIEKIDKFLP